MVGGAGRDTIYAGDGLAGSGTAADPLLGSDDFNTIYGDLDDGTVPFIATTADAELHRDWIYGDSGSDTIDASLGSDVIYGYAGDDTILADPAFVAPLN